VPDAFTEEVSGAAGDDLVEAVHAVFERASAHPDGVPDQTRRMFELAVVEVLANIAAHSPAGRRIPVRVTVAIDAGGCWGRIRDDAPPASVDLSGAEMPEALAESGRGLALVRGIVDRFEHAAGAAGSGGDDEPGGNVWTLVLGSPHSRPG
jgi:serine/threonine-protein kinase RsbW